MDATSGWFFEDPHAKDALRREVIEWVSPPTPFREYSKAKGPGGGVDCIRLCEAIMITLGVVEPFEFPRVPMDFTMHQDRSIVLEYLRGDYDDSQSKRLAAAFYEIPVDQESQPIVFHSRVKPTNGLLAGDLLAFKIGKAVNHLGILVNDVDLDFIQCFRPAGVIVSSLNDPTFRERLVSVFRARQRDVASNL